MRIRIGAIAFEIEVSLRGKAPVSHAKYVFPALRAGLNSLPASTLRKLPKTNIAYSISVALVDEARMRKLNRTFRGKDKPTDVLSFSRWETTNDTFLVGQPDIGDIVICWKIAKKQAAEQRVTTREELSRLTIHGLLHLFGYEHEQGGAAARKMFRLQEKILRSLKS